VSLRPWKSNKTVENTYTVIFQNHFQAHFSGLLLPFCVLPKAQRTPFIFCEIVQLGRVLKTHSTGGNTKLVPFKNYKLPSFRTSSLLKITASRCPFSLNIRSSSCLLLAVRITRWCQWRIKDGHSLRIAAQVLLTTGFFSWLVGVWCVAMNIVSLDNLCKI